MREVLTIILAFVGIACGLWVAFKIGQYFDKNL